MARDITLYHHENWDGTEYPDGMKEGNIPHAARIVKIADAFDNLTHPADVYRPELLDAYKPCVHNRRHEYYPEIFRRSF